MRFLSELSLEIFTLTFLKPFGFDKTALFDGLDEVIGVSSRLISLFDQELVKKENLMKIGKCLLNCAQSVKNVYSKYCEYHPNVSDTVEKVQPGSYVLSNPEKLFFYLVRD